MRRCLAVVLFLLAACSHSQPPAPPAHARPLSPAHPRVLAALLDAGKSPGFAFQEVTLQLQSQRVTAHTALTGPNVYARIGKSGARRVLFFLGGFNTSFAHGAMDAARIAEIVDARTVVLYADWGSQGKATAYRRDGRSARRNAPAFEHLLVSMRRALPAMEFDVFAHSMGSRVAIGAVAAAQKAGVRLDIKHVVLAAPDLGVRDYIAAMQALRAADRGTIYVSRRDKALFASAIIHLQHRLGQTSVERLNLPRTDIIDVTSEDRSKDGHGYAIHDAAILRDIYAVVTGVPAPHRVWCPSPRAGGVWLYCIKKAHTARGKTRSKPS